MPTRDEMQTHAALHQIPNKLEQIDAELTRIADTLERLVEVAEGAIDTVAKEMVKGLTP